jgi:hypothetical protein
MKERGKEGEKAFWDDHSFQDNCEWESVDEWTVDMKAEDESLKRLKEVIRHGKFVTIKTFDKKGQIFSLKDFPIGTIVRLSRDTQHNISYLNLSLKTKTIDLFGIVSEQNIGGQIQDVLFCFNTKNVEGNRSILANTVYPADFEVGKVDHDRRKTNLTKIKYFDSLERVNYVEVLQYGTRLRKRQPVPRASFNPSPDALNPGRVFI